MSEAQDPTATATIQKEPTERDVELLKRIVVRAQNEPLATDRDSLLNAYEAVFNELDLDVNENDVCFWLLLEILKPDVNGETLFDRFESVLRARHMEVVFDDESRTGETTTSAVEHRDHGDRGSTPSVQTRSISDASYKSSRDVTEQTEYDQHSKEEMDAWIDNPPPNYTALMQLAIKVDRRTLFRQFLEQVHEIKAEPADTYYESRLKFKVFTHWRNVVRQLENNYAQAVQFHNQHRGAQMLNQIFDSARVNRVQAMEEERLRATGLYQVTIVRREIAFSRKIDMKLKERYLRKLFNLSQRAVKYSRGLEDVLNQYQPSFNNHATRSAWTILYDRSQHLNQLRASAEKHNNLKTQGKALGCWTARSDSIAELKTTAVDMDYFYLTKKHFAQVRDEAQAKEAQRLENVETLKRERYETEYRDFRKRHKMKLARNCLFAMRNKIENIKRIRQEADEYQRTKVMRGVVVTWYNQSHRLKRMMEEDALEHAERVKVKYAFGAIRHRHQQIDSLQHIASQFEELHVPSVSAQYLKIMGRKVFELGRRQQDANEFRSRHDRQMVRSQIDQWRRKAAEQRGEGPLVLPPATPAQRRADQLNRLASTTPSFAPRTSFAARLRAEISAVSEIEEDVEPDNDG